MSQPDGSREPPPTNSRGFSCGSHTAGGATPSRRPPAWTTHCKQARTHPVGRVPHVHGRLPRYPAAALPRAGRRLTALFADPPTPPCVKKISPKSSTLYAGGHGVRDNPLTPLSLGCPHEKNAPNGNKIRFNLQRSGPQKSNPIFRQATQPAPAAATWPERRTGVSRPSQQRSRPASQRQNAQTASYNST